MNTSEQINELAAAMAKAQGAFDHAKKDVANAFFKSKYADLASVIDAAKKPLADNGLTVIQTTEFDESHGVILVTTLAHSSGQWITGRYPIHPVKNDPQSFGSAITYARRYCFSAITGIAADDDDGNAASGNHDAAQAQNELPWYNSLDADKEGMAKAIKDGKRTAEQIINNLCKTHKVSTKVREQIKALGAS